MTAIIAAGTGTVQPVTAFISISNTTSRVVGDGSVTATYRIASNGTVLANDETGALTVFETWLRGSGGSAANYEVSATQVSGSAVSGTLGSWISCSLSPTWNLTNGAANNSTKTGVISLSIRDVATHTVQDTASITLQAESDRP